jgi:hypothetical protein
LNAFYGCPEFDELSGNCFFFIFMVPVCVQVSCSESWLCIPMQSRVLSGPQESLPLYFSFNEAHTGSEEKNLLCFCIETFVKEKMKA